MLRVIRNHGHTLQGRPMNLTHDFVADDLSDLLRHRAERLVLTGFRCWMSGYEYRDIDCWETAWNVYAGELDGASARRAVTGLQHFVRTVRVCSSRAIRFFPHCCRHVCRDECMTLSLISALQHGEERTARIAAHHLTAASCSTAIANVTEAARVYSQALGEADLRLIAVAPEVVDTIAAFGQTGADAAQQLQ
jgi:hypothetical protein